MIVLLESALSPQTATAYRIVIFRPGEPLEVDTQVWELAGALKSASDAVRQAVSDRAKEDRDKVAQARQDTAVRQRVAVHGVDSKIKNCARTIVRHLEKHHSDGGKACTRGCLNRATASTYRDVFDAGIELALELDWMSDVTADESETKHYAIGASRPA